MENFKSPLFQGLRFVCYWALQVFFLRNVAVYDIGFCLLYVSVILLLPIDMNGVAVMLWGLVLGLSIDLIYDTMGIHAAACVFMGFMRNYVLSANRPSGGYEPSMYPTISSMGFSWFFTYAVSLIGLHHLAVFILESGSWSIFVLSLSKGLFSTVLTVLMLFAMQLVFYRQPNQSSY